VPDIASSIATTDKSSAAPATSAAGPLGGAMLRRAELERLDRRRAGTSVLSPSSEQIVGEALL
jgi:hypothetical protein